MRKSVQYNGYVIISSPYKLGGKYQGKFSLNGYIESDNGESITFRKMVIDGDDLIQNSEEDAVAKFIIYAEKYIDQHLK